MCSLQGVARVVAAAHMGHDDADDVTTHGVGEADAGGKARGLVLVRHVRRILCLTTLIVRNIQSYSAIKKTERGALATVS